MYFYQSVLNGLIKEIRNLGKICRKNNTPARHVFSSIIYLIKYMPQRNCTASISF